MATETQLETSREVGLEINTEETVMFMSYHQNEGQNHNIANEHLKMWQSSNISE
jgi:hypothetical protein